MVEIIVSWTRREDKDCKATVLDCLYVDYHSCRAGAGAGRLLFLPDRLSRTVEAVDVYRKKQIRLCSAELMLQDAIKIQLPGSAAGSV